MNSLDQIDVERLHAVIDGELHGRGVGHTFAMLTQIVGAIQSGMVKNLLVVAKNHNIAMQIRSYGAQLCNLYDIELHMVSDRIITTSGVTIKFVPLHDGFDRYVRGMRFDNYYLDNSVYNHETILDPENYVHRIIAPYINP